MTTISAMVTITGAARKPNSCPKPKTLPNSFGMPYTGTPPV